MEPGRNPVERPRGHRAGAAEVRRPRGPSPSGGPEQDRRARRPRHGRPRRRGHRRARLAGLPGQRRQPRGPARADVRDGRDRRGAAGGDPEGRDHPHRDPAPGRLEAASSSPSRRPARAGACAATSPSAGSGRPTSATTRPSASSPTGSTGSAWRQKLVELGAVEGDPVLIGHPDNAVVFDFKPGIDAGAQMLGRRGEDQRFTESRPAAQRRRAIDAAMPDRCRGRDPGRRGPSLRRGARSDRRRLRRRLGRGRPGGRRAMTRVVGRHGPARRGQGGVVVADDGHGWHRPRPGARPGRQPGRRTQPGSRPRPGLVRRDRRRPVAAGVQAPSPRPGPPAGGGVGGAGAAGPPLHRGVRPARPGDRARCCSPSTTSPAAATTATPSAPSTSCSSSVWSRSSTRTTPWPPPRSGSATTTGWPRWWPTWCTPTCWCCSPTSTGCTTRRPHASPGAG